MDMLAIDCTTSNTTIVREPARKGQPERLVVLVNTGDGVVKLAVPAALIPKRAK